MHQRKIPKPPRAAIKSRADLAADFFGRHQATITTLSVLLSAIGLVIASASTWMAWRQTDITFRDRQVPFYAVLYEQRVLASREIMAQAVKLQQSSSCVTSIPIVEKQFGISMEKRRSCVRETSSASMALDQAIRPSVSLWSKDTRQELIKLMLYAIDENQCSIFKLLNGKK